MCIRKKCSICLEESNSMKTTDDDTDDGMRVGTKLTCCFPELSFIGTFLICTTCYQKLEIVYEFRNLCLRSFDLQKDDDLKYVSDLDNSNDNGISEGDGEIKDVKNKTNYNKLHCKNSLLNSKLKSTSSISDNVSLQDHSNPGGVSYENDSENYICYHCNKNFNLKDDLVHHIQVEHVLSINCQICNSSFKTQTGLQHHLVDEHNIGRVKTRKMKRYKCSKCMKMYTTEKVMKIHLLRCDGLKRQLKNSNDLLIQKAETSELVDEVSTDPVEVKMDAEQKQINSCHICQSTFYTKYLLTRHVRNVHAIEKVHNCDICGQKFASRVYLTAHKRYHSGERPHICSFCGKGFITKSDLYHHEKIHANKRAYKCEQCPKAFNTSSDLHKHKICVHKDRSEWKYVCSFCNKRFPLKTNLDSHTKTHTGERNFACHLCDRRCINKSVLLRHIESHSNVRSFKCDICSLEYKYRKSLNVHLTKAHGVGDAKVPLRVKKYFCHICPKSYYANNKLQKHIRTHTGERPFECNVCNKRFIDKSYVKQHLKTAHDISESHI